MRLFLEIVGVAVVLWAALYAVAVLPIIIASRFMNRS